MNFIKTRKRGRISQLFQAVRTINNSGNGSGAKKRVEGGRKYRRKHAGNAAAAHCSLGDNIGSRDQALPENVTRHILRSVTITPLRNKSNSEDCRQDFDAEIERRR